MCDEAKLSNGEAHLSRVSARQATRSTCQLWQRVVRSQKKCGSCIHHHSTRLLCSPSPQRSSFDCQDQMPMTKLTPISVHRTRINTTNRLHSRSCTTLCLLPDRRLAHRLAETQSGKSETSRPVQLLVSAWCHLSCAARRWLPRDPFVQRVFPAPLVARPVSRSFRHLGFALGLSPPVPSSHQDSKG